MEVFSQIQVSISPQLIDKSNAFHRVLEEVEAKTKVDIRFTNRNYVFCGTWRQIEHVKQILEEIYNGPVRETLASKIEARSGQVSTFEVHAQSANSMIEPSTYASGRPVQQTSLNADASSMPDMTRRLPEAERVSQPVSNRNTPDKTETGAPRVEQDLNLTNQGDHSGEASTRELMMDTDMWDYMAKMNAYELRAMTKQFRVQLEPHTTEELTQVKIIPAEGATVTPDMMDAACETLGVLYQSLFSTVVAETCKVPADLDDATLCRSAKEEVSGMFHGVLCKQNEYDPRVFTFIGAARTSKEARHTFMDLIGMHPTSTRPTRHQGHLSPNQYPRDFRTPVVVADDLAPRTQTLYTRSDENYQRPASPASQGSMERFPTAQEEENIDEPFQQNQAPRYVGSHSNSLSSSEFEAVETAPVASAHRVMETSDDFTNQADVFRQSESTAVKQYTPVITDDDDEGRNGVYKQTIGGSGGRHQDLVDFKKGAAPVHAQEDDGGRVGSYMGDRKLVADHVHVGNQQTSLLTQEKKPMMYNTPFSTDSHQLEEANQPTKHDEKNLSDSRADVERHLQENASAGDSRTQQQNSYDLSFLDTGEAHSAPQETEGVFTDHKSIPEPMKAPRYGKSGKVMPPHNPFDSKTDTVLWRAPEASSDVHQLAKTVNSMHISPTEDSSTYQASKEPLTSANEDQFDGRREKHSEDLPSGTTVHQVLCEGCIQPIKKPREMPCSHVFCQECCDVALRKDHTCPKCSADWWKVDGHQPDGSLNIVIDKKVSLAGYERLGTICVSFLFPAGNLKKTAPEPGRPYQAFRGATYLPNNADGRMLLKQLMKTFDRKLLFKTKPSHKREADIIDVVGIHLKTEPSGNEGYPDPGYLSRLQEDLKYRGTATNGSVYAETDELKYLETKVTPNADTQKPKINIKKRKSVVLKYKYRENQWSPLNPEGKKQYDRSFLLQLQSAPVSLEKPAGLPKLPDVILDTPISTSERSFITGPPDFTPGFVKKYKKPKGSVTSAEKPGLGMGAHPH